MARRPQGQRFVDTTVDIGKIDVDGVDGRRRRQVSISP
jgi:hypothetical protein